MEIRIAQNDRAVVKPLFTLPWRGRVKRIPGNCHASN
jgi:hypothetical protein